ncbi:alpha/beta hydrolase [Hoyosella rhizosphaerae]|uniref:Esterase n=1 Tax=Hoyosella rhizosphaerae TaxID=1755582 RepID=A0A916XH07_9ACTN|nr:alpha/beta hydrolase [Hoyosella rhizosphaerae]MBN4928159.1 alpha/beta hydrolase [Hoyosella rhizosphaerae]GGC72877.1 esterase [Hoyosella rhizosphaerae]
MKTRPIIGAFIDVSGTPVHIREDGKPGAPPLVLVHGFAGSVHWFDRITELLRDSFHLIRVDLRGHGCTGGSHGIDAPSQGKMVAEIIEKLDLSDVTAVGHSFGCDVVLAAAEHSRRVSQLVLIGQAPDMSYAKFPAGNVLMTVPVLGGFLHSLPPQRIAEKLTASMAFAPGFAVRSAFGNSGQMFADHRATNPGMYKEVLALRPRRLLQRPLDQQVHESGIPTTVILGRHDQFYDAKTTEARYRSADANVIIIEDAGHSPMVERPQKVAQILREVAGGAS